MKKRKLWFKIVAIIQNSFLKSESLMKIYNRNNFPSKIKNTFYIIWSIRYRTHALDLYDLLYIHNVYTVKFFSQLKSNQLIL